MERYVQVRLINDDNTVFKCTNIIKTTQGYLFECNDKNRTFLLSNVVEVIDPFKLPNGFKINKV